MDAKGLMDLLSAGGWSGLEDAEKAVGAFNDRQQAQELEEHRAQARIVRNMVRTPEGKAFLAWLLEKTLMRPPGHLEINATSAEAYAIAKARREGQNGIAFMLLSALKAADEPENTETDDAAE